MRIWLDFVMPWVGPGEARRPYGLDPARALLVPADAHGWFGLERLRQRQEARFGHLSEKLF